MKVNVKWQKSLFEGVEIDTQQTPAVFKSQLYSLTGVPPERQKIMVKGGLLKDDSDWAKVGIKPNQKLMMMGSAEQRPAEADPDAEAEDAAGADEDMQPAVDYGSGLTNLGNTCYMNSSLQCLYSCDELRGRLQKYSGQGAMVSNGRVDASASLAVAMKGLFRTMEGKRQERRDYEPVAPVQVLAALRSKYPQFAQQGQGGMFMQQDAEECYTQILYTLKEKLDGGPQGEDTQAQLKSLFGVELATSLKSEETGEALEEKQEVYTFKCNISKDVNHLHEGIRLSLVEDREKTSEALGRVCLFKGSSKIAGLPKYLTVQLVRFAYRRDTQQKAKILRRVQFPMRKLDLLEFCTEALKENLKPARDTLKRIEDEKAQQKRLKRSNGEGDGAAPTPGDSGEGSEQGGGSLTGYYDLHAIVTHKGRIADSGHYVSWVRQDDGQWVEYDDDRVIPCTEEDILKLTGGGDWHMAYLCIYKAVEV